MANKNSRVMLVGFGSVGTHVAKLCLRRKHGPFSKVLIVGVSDSTGAIYCESGLDPEKLLEQKSGKGLSMQEIGKSETVTANNDVVQIYTSAEDMISSDSTDYTVLFDISPVHLDVGINCIRIALRQGIHVVAANKSPIVNHYEELMESARVAGCKIRFSATVCGGLPVINIGQRDMIGASLKSITGILNSTSMYILSEMEQGSNRDAALHEAQRRGIAEADPRGDVEGGDTANKLVIIANAVLSVPATLADVAITGITSIGTDDIQRAKDKGMVVRLVARAQQDSTSRIGYTLTVQPEEVPSTSFLGCCVGTDMAVEFVSDIFEVQSFKTNETGVFPTAAAMLRDLYAIA
eukprot:m.207906 g.207906  ORF g.207906 m.207906 type:complete len:351 (-) comp18949_c0_seq1:107-1159(-)